MPRVPESSSSTPPGAASKARTDARPLPATARPSSRSSGLDEDDVCEHGIALWEYCSSCEGDGDDAVFDADELGLDPEEDDQRA